MKKIITVVILGLSALALVACSTKKGPNGVPVTSRGSDDSAQAYAMQGGSAYRSGRGFYKNAMKAPSNQIYYFAFNSSNLRPQDMRALTIQANYLAAHPSARVRLEGNTDNRGSREYNVALGWRRDQAVARVMEQQGVRPRQIQMVSYGKERPAVSGNNDRAWALNRRVNFIYKVTS